MPIAGFSSTFLEDGNVGNSHPPIHRLAHIVNRQQTNLHRRKRFHFNSSLAVSLDLRGALNGRCTGIDNKFNRHSRQCKRMTKRNQITRPLRTHDGRDACNSQHIPLLGTTRLNDGQRFRLHADRAGCHGDAMRLVLRADIHHMRLAGGIKVRQAAIVGGRNGRVLFIFTHWQ